MIADDLHKPARRWLGEAADGRCNVPERTGSGKAVPAMPAARGHGIGTRPGIGRRPTELTDGHVGELPVPADARRTVPVLPCRLLCSHVSCRGGMVEQVAHEPGSIHTWAAFSSASTGEGFEAGKNVRFVITSRHGKDIKAYSDIPTEDEVLLRAGTRVRVTRESKRIEGMLHVYVEEIDDGEV